MFNLFFCTHSLNVGQNFQVSRSFWPKRPGPKCPGRNVRTPWKLDAHLIIVQHYYIWSPFIFWLSQVQMLTVADFTNTISVSLLNLSNNTVHGMLQLFYLSALKAYKTRSWFVWWWALHVIVYLPWNVEYWHIVNKKYR